MNAREVEQFFNTALECSIYVAPREPGLTYDELMEVGTRAGLRTGEIQDAIPKVVQQTFGGAARRFPPNQGITNQLVMLTMAKNPEYRNIAAFDFVYSQINSVIKEVGIGRTQIDRQVLVDRAIAQGLPPLDVEATITIMVLCNYLAEDSNQLRPPRGWTQGSYEQIPSQQLGRMNVPHSPVRERVYRLVKDVIERRSDGRPRHAEPFDAFLDAMDRLGYRPFRLWWSQTVAELRHSNPASSPISVLVLSAALVEGSLTFVVKHAQALGLGVFGSTDFTREPRNWKIDDLVASAARGGDSAIFDEPTRLRVSRLIGMRQRIHAGRVLSDFPVGGAVDLKPEEAREGKAIAEEVVRRVLDWLERYPPSTTS